MSRVVQTSPQGLKGINLLDAKAVESRQYVFGEDFTIRSQTLEDPAANVLWRWVTDGRWRLVLPRTFEAEGTLKTIPSDGYLKPDLKATLQTAQPMLYDLQADPNEQNNLAGTYPEMVTALRSKLNAHWKPIALLCVTTLWSFVREFSPPHIWAAAICPFLNDDNALRQ